MTSQSLGESDDDVPDGPLPQGKPGKAKGRSAADWASRALMAMDGDRSLAEHAELASSERFHMGMSRNDWAELE